MNKSNIYKLIAVAVVAAGTFSGVTTTASAKTHKDVKAAKLIKKIKTKHYYEFRGKHGIVYSNYKLKKVVGDLKKHKHTKFKSDTKFVLKLANGKKATYRLIQHKHFKGVVLNRDVKVVKVKKHHHAKSHSKSNATKHSNVAASNASSSSAAAKSTSASTSSASSTGSSSASSTSASNTTVTTGTTGTTSTTSSAVSSATTSSSTSSSSSSSTSSSSNSNSSSATSSASSSAATSSSANSASSSSNSNSSSTDNSASTTPSSSTSSNSSSTDNSASTTPSSSTSSNSSSTDSSASTTPSSSTSSNSSSTDSSASTTPSSSTSSNTNSTDSSASTTSSSSVSSNTSSADNSSASSTPSSSTSDSTSNSDSSNGTSSSTSDSDTSSSSTSSESSSADSASFYTSAELAQIKEYQSEASSLMANNDTDIYDETPTANGSFNPGKLNDAYIKNSIDWINFFRKINGLQPITNDDQFNSDAQNAATVLDNLGGMTHFLNGITKPNYISDAEWQNATSTLRSSNLSDNSIKPYQTTAGFLSDANNASSNSTIPGHRLWLLGNINKVGIGQADAFGVYKYDGTPTDDNLNPNVVEFPAANLYPIELLNNAYWSLSVPSYLDDSSSKPTVTVHDNTNNQDVSITYSEDYALPNGSFGGYGQFKTDFWFMPDQSALHPNHSYTITVNGLPGYSSPYTYTTKLFSLGTPAL